MVTSSAVVLQSPERRAPGSEPQPIAPGKLGPRSPGAGSGAVSVEDRSAPLPPRSQRRVGAPIRVLLAEGRELLRQALRTLLEREGMVVVAEVGEGRHAVQAARRLHPDVALLGIDLPRLHGLATSRHLQRVSPETRIIVLSVDGERRFARDAMAAGARAFLLWDQPAEELLVAIREVTRGRLYFGSREELPRRGPRSFASRPTPGLSRRESEVLDLVAEGLRMDAIAELLGISVATVSSHRTAAIRKLQAAHRERFAAGAWQLPLAEG